MLSDPQFLELAIKGIAAILLILFSGNLWFIRRMVDQIEKMSQVVNSVIPMETAKQQENLKNLSKSHEELRQEVHKIGQEFKKVSELQVRVGILEYALRIRKNAKSNMQKR